ncbi:MAG: hypothetical protein HC918_14420, partial [Oscillatoriales cyanobacterium SM2_1_8]|nr:hypothetical protein [Oscillatoriales cyanobacterium SM2_1_8]
SGKPTPTCTVCPHLQTYVASVHGEIQSPYAVLPTPDLDGKPLAVREGEEALLVYQDAVFGQYRDRPEAKATIAETLRQYCQLDTLAMTVLWQHWLRP